MEEEDNDIAVPMDLESDEEYTNTPHEEPHTLEELSRQEDIALRTVADWLLKITGKQRIRDIDPWEGFIAPYTLAKTERSSHTHMATIQLNTLRRQPCPSAIPIQNCKNAVISTMAKEGKVKYDRTEVYPFTFVLKRWVNELGTDLGCSMLGQPQYISTLSDEVMKNIPGAVPGTFAMLPNGSTQDTLKNGSSATHGVALANRDFGIINEKFLRAFGCIKEEHLTRGCLQIPTEIADEAGLARLFSGLKWRVKTFGHRLFVEDAEEEKENVDGKDDSDDGATMETDDADDIFKDNFFLVPCTSLIAWPYEDDDEESRAKYGIYGVQIRARNKKTGEVFNPYWLVDGSTFKMMLYHCAVSLVKDIEPINLNKWGLRIYPFQDATTWDNPMCFQELSPLSTEEETNAFLAKKRRFSVKFQTGYVLFPEGTSAHPKLAPIMPKDWYRFRQFMRSNITAVRVNDQQRLK